MKIDKPVSVVIAEDETLVADLIAHELASMGMEVVGRAANGRQAVELTAQPFHILGEMGQVIRPFHPRQLRVHNLAGVLHFPASGFLGLSTG